jgi:ribonuclease HII
MKNKSKILPDYLIESNYSNSIIAGIDEVGRGALAGPILAAAVIIDKENIIPGINDSKKLSARAREILYEKITACYSWSVALVPAEDIDNMGIVKANILSCCLAAKNLPITPDILLVDGNMKFEDPRFISIKSGDTISVSIAAASIVAKVTRDRIMSNLSADYPYYLWYKNVGYGTKEHIEAIIKYGITPYHRKSFQCKSIIY